MIGATAEADVRGTILFEEFFRTEYPTLVRALYLLCGSRHDAEDIAQEALVRAFERWGRVKTMESPTGYVYRIALRLTQRRFRRLAAQARRLLPAPLSSPDPAWVAEARSDVLRALRRLAPGQREALVLREWLGMDTSEIARALRIRPASARSRLHRGRESFKASLGEGYE